MVKRTRKPPVKPEVRRDWLRRNEESGESPPQIAAKDRFDVRTVRKQIDMAKQEREVREARSTVLRDALERHYEDLRKFADGLNSEILGLQGVPSSPDDDLMEAALRQHLPRSPIWTYISKRQTLQQRVDEEQQKLERGIEESVKADHRLTPLINAGLDGIVPGVIAVLVAEAKQWSHGNTEHTLKDSLVMEPVGEGLVNPRFGFSHIGPMGESEAKDYVPIVHDVLDDLESSLRDSQEYRDLEKTIAEIGRLGGKLREELAVIRLRRIVPGRCKYCPL
jgi:cell fate (sporulation/competence/biofilm development) regulator YlbF (YheA/YmcA/DUF963 family)